ncbi:MULTISPECIES: hypothetical protein [unclassified Streptomyces]|uniref:hypothetical protein n=1 Tax=Streptomyces TaxID=1883 RepID=UPI00143EC553|nr:hypothetical protein [Streptomyces sp. RPA4-2]QIY60430.1 hypothetical protein HEP85_00275 [Streptomyces sp. RPA4-2]
MSSMTKRLSIALASTALAGGALLGAGGSASAATASVPVQHTQYVSATSVTGSEQAGRQGVSAARWYEDQVEAATSWHGVSAARWYEDQVEAAASWHGVTAARWYQDQVEWSLNHS